MMSTPNSPHDTPEIKKDAKPNAVPKAAPKAKGESERAQDVSAFIKNIWFLVLYFLLLMMIASFGLIAET